MDKWTDGITLFSFSMYDYVESENAAKETQLGNPIFLHIAHNTESAVSSIVGNILDMTQYHSCMSRTIRLGHWLRNVGKSIFKMKSN